MGQRLRLNLTAGSALTDNAHEKVAEAVVEPLDVVLHSHGRMGRTPAECVHAAQEGPLYCTGAKC